MKSKVIVTTTSSLDCAEIIQYIKPIAAHVVAGTGFASDFVASFSDFFGGRSGSYRKQLESIYTEAIEVLKNTAVLNGANAIVGLKVDIDEISGKNKTMFMITAVGTAVVCKFSDLDRQTSGFSSSLTADDLRVLREKSKIKDSADSGALYLNDEKWRFVTENKMSEIGREIFQSVISHCSVASNSIIDDESYARLLGYFEAIQTEDRSRLLYDCLCVEKTDSGVSCLIKIMNQLSVFDAALSKSMMMHADEGIRCRALQVAVIDKDHYMMEDVSALEDLIIVIGKQFVKQCTYSKQKKLFSSAQHDVWICSCGHKNEINREYCENCMKDEYGFSFNQVNPEKAIKKLKEDVALIKQFLVR